MVSMSASAPKVIPETGVIVLVGVVISIDTNEDRT